MLIEAGSLLSTMFYLAWLLVPGWLVYCSWQCSVLDIPRDKDPWSYYLVILLFPSCNIKLPIKATDPPFLLSFLSTSPPTHPLPLPPLAASVLVKVPARRSGLPPHCAKLHCTAPRCTALHCTALHSTAVHWPLQLPASRLT